MFDPKNLILDNPDEGVFRVHRSAMTSLEVLRMEQERIFNKCWLYLCHESEVENPGDYRRRNVAGRPLFFIRGSDGKLRVFLNTCTHRGALICRHDQGHADVLQCFYHAWSFNNHGDLVGVPDEAGYGTVSTELRWVSSRRRAWKATAALSLSASIRMSKSS